MHVLLFSKHHISLKRNARVRNRWFFCGFTFTLYKSAARVCVCVIRGACDSEVSAVICPRFDDVLLNRPCFGASRPQHVRPNNNNKHPGVELLPQCEDLNEEHVALPRHSVRGNPIPRFSPFLHPSPVSRPSLSLRFCVCASARPKLL